jgi:SAM-dependent methyltransferase
MSMEAFAEEAKRFAKSSAYQFGDRTGFGVNLSESVRLPGKCSPSDYLDTLGLDKLPKKVLVICAGNGGLAVECFARGAKQVIALEPRTRFANGVQGVKRLLDTLWRLEETFDCDLSWQPNWPKVGRDQGLKNFDLILWPEGVEEITAPKATFQSVADCLAPGGRLIVELIHGTHQWVEKINSWRPTGHAVVDMSDEVFGGPPTAKTGGRSATSKIYTLTLPGKKAAPAKPKPKAKPAPKKIAPKDDLAPETKAEAPAPAPSETKAPEPEVKVETEAPEVKVETEETPAAPKVSKKTSKKKKKKRKKKVSKPKTEDGDE